MGCASRFVFLRASLYAARVRESAVTADRSALTDDAGSNAWFERLKSIMQKVVTKIGG
jgi:hypothetical protein